MCCVFTCGQSVCDGYTFHPDIEKKDLWLWSSEPGHAGVSSFLALNELPDFWLVFGSSVSSLSLCVLTAPKGVISLYLAEEKKPIGKYYARNEMGENTALFQHFNLIDVLDFNDHARNLCLGSISLEVYSLCENQRACRKLLFIEYQHNSSLIWNYPRRLILIVKASE